MPARPFPRQWFIPAMGVAQICSWGSLYYAFPLIAEQTERDTGWTRSSLYGAASFGLLLSAAAAFPIGRAIDRGKGRLIMAGGSVLAGCLMLAWSQVNDLLGFYAIVSLLGALQAATLYEPAFAVIARRAGANRARAGITAVTLWGGFASTVFIPLIQFLIDTSGWRGALIALGAINLTVCAGLYWAAIQPHADATPSYPTHPGHLPPRHVWNAVQSPVFWTLALAFTAHAAAFTAFTFHLYPLLLERGFDPYTVVVAMALIGPAQVGGRVAISILAGKASMRVIGSVVVIGFPLGFGALIVLPPSYVLILVVTLLYGAANGVLTIVRGAAVPEMLTRESYGAVMGVMNIPATIARAFAPVGAAFLWSASHSYDSTLVVILALSLVMAFGFWSAALLSARRAGAAT